MKYPHLNQYAADKMMAATLCDDLSVDPDAGSWPGGGDRVDLAPLEQLAGRVRGEVDHAKTHNSMGDPAKDVVEGSLCGDLHLALASIESECYEALDDPGFWAYLSLTQVHFRDYICWRHKSTIDNFRQAPNDPKTLSNARKYFFDPTLKEGVLVRMYMRGRLTNESGNYELARGRNLKGKIGSGDLFRSHIFRVRTGESPELAKALSRYWLENAWLTTDKPRGGLRALAKLLNRRRSNIVADVLDADESEQTITHLTEMLREDDA